MNGSDFFTAVTNILGGFQIDSVLFYQLLNIARTNREMTRPWMRLRKKDTSNTIAPVSIIPTNPTSMTAYNSPSDFLMLSREGEIVLYDNNQTWQVYNEIPMDLQIQYLQDSQLFFFDHANGKFYVLGIIDRQYTAYIFYQADFGDITANTTWINIPSRYHMILAFDVASMYRLGVDYDDVNARNAEDNNRQAELLFSGMTRWDDNLQRSSVTRMDYPTIGEAPTFMNHKIQM